MIYFLVELIVKIIFVFRWKKKKMFLNHFSLFKENKTLMKSKIKQLRKLFERREEEEEKRYYPLIPKRYVDYCEGDDMPVGLFEKKTTS